MEKYVTEQEFAKLSKGKHVKEYPNPHCKDIDGVSYYIMTPDASCTVSVMKPEDYEWYTGMTFDTYQKKAKEMYGEDNSELVVISTNTQAGYSWFPTDLVCGTKEVYLGAGIIRSRFSIRTELAERTGCMLTGENAGSFQCYFRSAKVNEAIRILNENHWKCPKYEA